MGGRGTGPILGVPRVSDHSRAHGVDPRGVARWCALSPALEHGEVRRHSCPGVRAADRPAHPLPRASGADPMGSRGASRRRTVLPAGVDPRCRGAGGGRTRPAGTPAGDRPQGRDDGGSGRRGHAGGASGAPVGRRAIKPPDQRVGGPPLSGVRSPRADDLLPKVRVADAEGTLFGLRPEGARKHPADRSRRDARTAAEERAARAEGGMGCGGGLADPVRRELCRALSPLPSEPLHTSADAHLLHRDRRVLADRRGARSAVALGHGRCRCSRSASRRPRSGSGSGT